MTRRLVVASQMRALHYLEDNHQGEAFLLDLCEKLRRARISPSRACVVPPKSDEDRVYCELL